MIFFSPLSTDDEQGPMKNPQVTSTNPEANIVLCIDEGALGSDLTCRQSLPMPTGSCTFLKK